MRLSTNFISLAFISQGLLALGAPIDFPETSDALEARDLEISDVLDSRDILDLSVTLDAREWGADNPDELSSREAEDLELALRSLPDEDILALEARGIRGIGKLAKVATGPIKKLASAIRPSSRRTPSGGSTPAAPKSKPKPKSKSKSPGKGASKSGSKKVGTAGKSGKPSSSAGKKSGAKPKKVTASASPSKGKGSQGKKAKAAGSKKTGPKSTGKKAPGSKPGKGKSKKASSGSGKGKGKGKEGKKTPTSRTRSRTFNVNLDPGTLLNAGAAIANVVTGLAN